MARVWLRYMGYGSRVRAMARVWLRYMGYG